MDVDSREELLLRIEDSILCGKAIVLYSEHCRVTLADASNPFAIAQMMHTNGKSLDDFPTVCVNNLDMAETIIFDIDKDVRSFLTNSHRHSIEFVLPVRSPMPEILSDGFPYIRLRIFEDGIMNEIITHVARPLAIYVGKMHGCHMENDDNAELCRELQVADALTIFFDAHRKPVVIDSSGRSEDDITKIIGKHETAKHRKIPKLLEQNGVSRYRPQTPMIIVDMGQISVEREMALRLGLLTFESGGLTQDTTIVKNLSPTGDTVEAAARFYSSLKAIDSIGLPLVLVEYLPNDGFGPEINDRLRTVAYDLYRSNEILNMCS